MPKIDKSSLAGEPVSFTHRRRNDTAQLRTFFGSEVIFGAAADEVIFPTSIKQMAVVDAEPYLNEVLTTYSEQAIAARSTKLSSFGLNVENLIATHLPHGKARVGEVARKLGVSQRTLARRLSAEGLTFATVLQRLNQTCQASSSRRDLVDL